MEIQEALRVMRALASGVSPETGVSMEADSVYRQPETVKALNRPLGALVQMEQRERNKPVNGEESGSIQKMPRSVRRDAAAPISTRSRRRTIVAWVQLWPVS
jgi:hypothetical protein